MYPASVNWKEHHVLIDSPYDTVPFNGSASSRLSHPYHIQYDGKSIAVEKKLIKPSIAVEKSL